MAVQEEHLHSAELLLARGANINYSSGPLSAFFAAMTHVQFGNAIWVLNHGYTHDLPMARRLLAVKKPRPGQEALKMQALEMIDRLIAEQNQKN